ncbi:MAG TPA: hypothetical protein VLO29_08715 [Salegentibacter sp.]|nr:hypothetical protein [Salegentibacter sp.]
MERNLVSLLLSGKADSNEALGIETECGIEGSRPEPGLIQPITLPALLAWQSEVSLNLHRGKGVDEEKDNPY